MRPRADRARRRIARASVTLAALLASAWVGGAVLAARLEARGDERAAWLRLAYAPLCHRLPERSLALDGVPLGACARCTGLYAGGALGLIAAASLLVGASRWPRARGLLIAAAPTAVDGLLAVAGLSPLDNLGRFALAVPAGAAAGVFLGLAVYDLCGGPRPDPGRGVLVAGGGIAEGSR